MKNSLYFYFITHCECIVFTNRFITTYFQNNSNISKTKATRKRRNKIVPSSGQARLVIILFCSISTLTYTFLTYLN